MTDKEETIIAALIDAESAMFHVLADRGIITPTDRAAMRNALTAVREAIAQMKETAQ